MTIDEIEKFIEDIRQAGGTGETPIQVITPTGGVKDIKSGRTHNVTGFPAFVLAK